MTHTSVPNRQVGAISFTNGCRETAGSVGKAPAAEGMWREGGWGEGHWMVLKR